MFFFLINKLIITTKSHYGITLSRFFPNLSPYNGENDLIIKYLNNIPTISNNYRNSRSTPKHLSIYYQNVLGINTKLSQIHMNAALLDYDIIVLSETLLSTSIK